MTEKIIEDLLDAAFKELQHDTGPTEVEWVHSRRVLKKEFTAILRRVKHDLTTTAYAASLKALSPADRATAIHTIKDHYCEHCGAEHISGSRCQCWNDE